MFFLVCLEKHGKQRRKNSRKRCLVYLFLKVVSGLFLVLGFRPVVSGDVFYGWLSTCLPATVGCDGGICSDALPIFQPTAARTLGCCWVEQSV